MRGAIAALALAAGCGWLGDEPAAVEAPSAPAAVDADVSGFVAAPPFEATAWVRGEPVDVGGGGLVLVEQWATWCGPCVEQIPHLAALQARHAGALTVVGVSDEDVGTVTPFVRRHEDMAYTIAVTTPAANGAWFDLARNDAIPYAFLVRGDRVLWHGHPEGVDAVVEAALAGTWTPALAAEVAGLGDAVDRYLAAARDGRPGEVGAERAAVIGSAWLGAADANNLAWAVLTEVPEPHRDLELALALATRACEATGRANWGNEDTLGLALFQAGRAAEAIAVQEAAVRLCHESGAGAACGELEERLASFRAAG